MDRRNLRRSCRIYRLAETPQTLALMRLGRQSAEKGADFRKGYV
ncbi:hypothetical protein [Peribacillus frigoritolerans]